MKTSIKILLLLPALIAGLTLISVVRVTAQTYSNLHSFTAFVNFTNSDGASPRAGLIASGNTLYGASSGGGTLGGGTLFAMNAGVRGSCPSRPAISSHRIALRCGSGVPE